MLNMTIDGKQIQVSEGTTVLQAARQAGIPIPTLCDHPNLKPYGGCRLCLVEIEGMRTPQTSCTMPVTNNMVVRTDSEQIHEARKYVLTLLFSERNHFCMYCQESGGDCELQNAAYKQEMTHWPLQPTWTPYPLDASHPYFVLEHNRCILCRRCVRACGELVGNFTLSIQERGANSLVVADFGVPLGESSCISCGTCVQICPTGALIDRESAYRGLEAQLTKVKSVCTACSLGCTVDLLTRDNHLVRIEGDWDAPINSGVLCEAGRYLPLREERERVLTPLVRENGFHKPVTWEEALDRIASRLRLLAGMNGKGVAAVASTRLSIEALALFKSIFAETLGSQMVTSVEEGATTSAAARVARELGRPFEGGLDALKDADCILIAGTDLAREHQVMGFLVKRSIPRGAHLITIGSAGEAIEERADVAIKPGFGDIGDVFRAIQTSLTTGDGNKTHSNPDAMKTGISSDEIEAAAELLKHARKPVFIYGAELTPSDLKALLALARFAGALDEGRSSVLSPKGGANSLAASALGLEHPFSLNGHQAVFIALGDDQLSQEQIGRLEGVPFLVAQCAYHSPLTAMADVVLPATTWAEEDGRFVNLEGIVQSAHAALVPPRDVWSNRAILEALAARLGAKSATDWKKILSEAVTPVKIIVE